jgi:hypothetical protein
MRGGLATPSDQIWGWLNHLKLLGVVWPPPLAKSGVAKPPHGFGGGSVVPFGWLEGDTTTLIKVQAFNLYLYIFSFCFYIFCRTGYFSYYY